MTTKELLFRPSLNQDDWDALHPLVHEIYFFIEALVNQCGLNLVVTSMVRKKDQIPGESGVHSTGRALDCVAEVQTVKGSINHQTIIADRDLTCRLITSLCNIVYFRQDRKQTVIYHNVTSGNHFHIQVPWDSRYEDLNGSSVMAKDYSDEEVREMIKKPQGVLIRRHFTNSSPLMTLDSVELSHQEVVAEAEKLVLENALELLASRKSGTS